jgi:hypothetical protein
LQGCTYTRWTGGPEERKGWDLLQTPLACCAVFLRVWWGQNPAFAYSQPTLLPRLSTFATNAWASEVCTDVYVLDGALALKLSFFFVVEKCYGAQYISHSFSSINVGSGFHF